MHKQYGQDQSISWAIAGRSKEKLTAVKEAIGISNDIPLLIVDSNNESSIAEMVQQTKCVLTTAVSYTHLTLPTKRIV